MLSARRFIFDSNTRRNMCLTCEFRDLQDNVRLSEQGNAPDKWGVEAIKNKIDEKTAPAGIAGVDITHRLTIYYWWKEVQARSEYIVNTIERDVSLFDMIQEFLDEIDGLIDEGLFFKGEHFQVKELVLKLAECRLLRDFTILNPTNFIHLVNLLHYNQANILDDVVESLKLRLSAMSAVWKYDKDLSYKIDLSEDGFLVMSFFGIRQVSDFYGNEYSLRMDTLHSRQPRYSHYPWNKPFCRMAYGTQYLAKKEFCTDLWKVDKYTLAGHLAVHFNEEDIKSGKPLGIKSRNFLNTRISMKEKNIKALVDIKSPPKKKTKGNNEEAPTYTNEEKSIALLLHNRFRDIPEEETIADDTASDFAVAVAPGDLLPVRLQF